MTYPASTRPTAEPYAGSVRHRPVGSASQQPLTQRWTEHRDATLQSLSDWHSLYEKATAGVAPPATTPDTAKDTPWAPAAAQSRFPDGAVHCRRDVKPDAAGGPHSNDGSQMSASTDTPGLMHSGLTWPPYCTSRHVPPQAHGAPSTEQLRKQRPGVPSVSNQHASSCPHSASAVHDLHMPSHTTTSLHWSPPTTTTMARALSPKPLPSMVRVAPGDDTNVGSTVPRDTLPSGGASATDTFTHENTGRAASSKYHPALLYHSAKPCVPQDVPEGAVASSQHHNPGKQQPTTPRYVNPSADTTAAAAVSDHSVSTPDTTTLVAVATSPARPHAWAWVSCGQHDTEGVVKGRRESDDVVGVSGMRENVKCVCVCVCVQQCHGRRVWKRGHVCGVRVGGTLQRGVRQ